MKLILGGGIAGLVYAYMHPEHKVIAESAGGSMASELPIGPRYIHATANAMQMLQGLSLYPTDRKTVRSFTLGTTDGDRQYNFKTRGVAELAYDKTRVRSHDVWMWPTVAQITQRLLEVMKDRIIADRVEVVHADARQIMTRDHGVMEYSELVSTIPLPHFAKLLVNDDVNWGGHYIQVPVRFVHHEIHDGTWPWPGVDYVYFSDYGAPYSRVSRLDARDKEWACFEYPGMDSVRPRPVGSLFDGPLGYRMELSRVQSSVLFPMGRVVTRVVPTEVRAGLWEHGIKLFGRFAEWDDSLLTHDLIDRARWAK